MNMTLGQLREDYPVGSCVEFDEDGVGEVVAYVNAITTTTYGMGYIKQDSQPMVNTVMIEPQLRVLIFDGNNYRKVFVPVDNVWRCTI